MKQLLILTLAFSAAAASAAPPAAPASSRLERNDARAAIYAKQRHVRNASGITPARPLHKKTAKPSKAISAESSVYGWLGYSDNTEAKCGLYQFAADGPELKWVDPQFTQMQNGWELSTSWLNADGTRVCGYALDLYYGYGQDLAYVEIDFNTGKLEKSVPMDYYTDPLPSVAALNTAEGYIYSMGFDAEDEPYLGRASVDNPGEIEIIRGLQSVDDLLCSLTYCEEDGYLYAISQPGHFIRIDPEWNSTVVIDNLGIAGFKSYITGLCYSEKEKVFYWNSQATNPDVPGSCLSAIYAIDAAKRTLEKKADLEDNDEYFALYCASGSSDTSLPAVPMFAGDTFSEGALSGEVQFTLPRKTIGGDDLQGDLSWTAYLDGTEAKTGTAAPGAQVTVAFSDLAPGTHVFSLEAASGDKKSRRASVSLFIGFDTPASPANVALSATEVKWDAVTDGVNGGYVNPAEISYEVYLNGESTGTYSATSAPVAISADGPLTAYRASVEAIFKGNRSQPAVSPKLIAGRPLDLDVAIRPTAAQWDLCTVTDGNGDGNTWVLYDETDDSFFNSQFSKKGEADDYLIFPAVNFQDADAYYEVSFDARSRRDHFPDEFLEVRLGNSPSAAAMTVTVMEKTQMVPEWKRYSALFHVPAAGANYLAARCCSGYDQYGIFLKNVNITRSPVTDDAPAPASALKATGAPKGELKATVTLTLPTLRMDGLELPADASLTAEVSGVSTVSVTGRPGETVSADVTTRQGYNIITVAVKYGNTVSPKTETQVYTGVSVPTLVSDLKADVQPDNTTVKLTWEAPESGDDLGFVDPAGVSYVVYIHTEGGWVRVNEVGAGVTEYTFDGSEYAGKEMQIVQLGVLSKNIAGNNNNVRVVAMTLGKPYALPLNETFDDQDGQGYCVPLTDPWMMLAPSEAYGAKWGFSRLASVSDAFASIPGGALVCDPDGKATSGMIEMPKFATLCGADEEVVVTLRSYTGPDAAAEMTLLGQSYGMEEAIPVVTVRPSSRDWTDTEAVLPAALTGREWISLLLDVRFTSGRQLFLLDSVGAEARKTGGAEAMETDGLKIMSGKGFISVEAPFCVPVTVTAADGRALYSGEAARIPLPGGVYIVKAGARTVRVIVK